MQLARRPPENNTTCELDREGALGAWEQPAVTGSNPTRSRYPREACFHELFEKQVELTPRRGAVEHDGSTLTYKELDERATRWARVLRSLGVGPDVLVGVCLEPSLDLLTALLSVLKAGGAYVPLDPAYPANRLTFMVEDAALSIVITSEDLRGAFPSGAVRLLCGEDLNGAIPPTSGVAEEPTAESLAYVLYTSGSTGRPKGAMITHRGLVNYLTWAVEAYEVDRGSGAPVHSSISFDLTITGLFAPLLTGGCVTLLSSQRPIDGLSALLKRKRQFSLVKITPAHLDLLRSQLSPADLSGSTHVFVIGGEALTGESLRFWQEQAPDITLVNEYGPTETVVGCCVYFVPRGERINHSVPIGRPIANTQLYVLDADLAPAPIGVAGELFIGGDGVARGYLNRPDLTAEKFIPNPFKGDDPDASPTLYRTGDLVRYRSDGNLEFLGRMDHQVKVQGYRIETGEIEAILATHPHIEAAVVVAKENPPGERYLVAYYVPTNGGPPGEGDLREFLKKQVPDYMVPTVFSPIESLPLTHNGKVDRGALPEPHGRPEHASISISREDITGQLIGLWEKVLERSPVTLDDHFFEMGGNSLLAVRLVVEINRLFKTDLRSVVLYENPTIRQLAAVVESGTGRWEDADVIWVLRGNGGRPVFVLNVFSELFALASKLAQRPESFRVSHVSWEDSTLQAAARLQTALMPTLHEIAKPHTARILKSNLTKPVVLMGFSYGGPLAFEVAHQLKKAGAAVDAVILLDADLRMPRIERVKQWVRELRAKFARHLQNTFRHGPAYLYRKASERRQQDQKRSLTASRDPLVLDTTDHAVRWEFIERIWINALRRYRPQPLDAHGFLIRAEQTSYTRGQNYDGCLGWRGLYTRGLVSLVVHGDHFTMWHAPHSNRLAEHLIQSLDSLDSSRLAG